MFRRVVNMDMGMGVGNSIITYDLNAPFNAVNQTFSNTQVLNTIIEGIQNGSLTVVDTGVGTVKIVSNKLELVGDNNWNATGIYHTNGTSKALGKSAFFTYSHVNLLNMVFSFEDSIVQDRSAASIGFQTSSTDLLARGNDTNSRIVGLLTNDAEYKIALIAGGYDTNGIAFKSGDVVGDFTFGGRLFIKGGIFTNWTLLWAEAAGNDATLYASANQHSASNVSYDNIIIPTFSLNPITIFDPAYGPNVSPNNNVVDVTISDMLLDINVTFPAGAATFQIRFRYQDASNFWNVKALSGTAGTDLTLHKTTATVEGVAVASADVDFSAAAHNIRIIVEGSTIFKVYVDGVLKLTYNGPDTAFQTETEVQLVDVGSAFTENTLTAHHRTNPVWSAEISRATRGIY